MGDWVVLLILGVCCLIGVALTALRLPGTWWILLCAVGYLWLADWPGQTARLLGWLGAAAVIGELIELGASAVLVKHSGASNWAGWGAMAGGVLGAVFLSFVVPILFIGTVAGAMLGCVLGAAGAEWLARRRLEQSARVGLFAAIGFAVGLAAKVGVAITMSAILLLGSSPAAPGYEAATA